MPLLLHDPLASWLVGGAALVLVAGEVGATYVGRARDGERRPLRSAAEALLLTRRRDGVRSRDRGTVWIVAVGARLGVVAAILIAVREPRLRAYANDWWTLGLGIAVVVAGVALRAWAIVTLGRFFRRQVTIEPGQRLVRDGPYRFVRHPSYAGLVLAIGGLGLAFGSWVAAAVALLCTVLALLPRIHVEERALAETFGAAHEDYARSTARLVPHVW